MMPANMFDYLFDYSFLNMMPANMFDYLFDYSFLGQQHDVRQHIL